MDRIKVETGDAVLEVTRHLTEDKVGFVFIFGGYLQNLLKILTAVGADGWGVGWILFGDTIDL